MTQHRSAKMRGRSPKISGLLVGLVFGCAAMNRLGRAAQAGETLQPAGVVVLTADAAPADTSWQGWLDKKLLPPDEGKGMMRAFVEKQIQPLPLPRRASNARPATARADPR
jgi:hypothetical protein